MKFSFLLSMVCMLLAFTALPIKAQAQQGNIPALPTALQELVDRGAQMRFLGRANGMDGWVAIYQGQENYYYVTPDGTGFLMGVLFDKEGTMVTMEQVSALQKEGGEVLDFLAADKPAADLNKTMQATNKAFQYKTPAERMFGDVENSNWIQLGNDDAPVIYSFMDPQCGHCHEFMKDMKSAYIERGLIQLRMIPVGFREETLAQAAFLLASADAEKRWYNHLDGVVGALPAKQDINTQGIQKNLALMQSWNFDATPITVYRDKTGKVKIIRGRASNLANILTDISS